MKNIIIFLLFISFSSFAAELPDKGIEPPTVVQSPPNKPGEPGIPVGSGMAILSGFAMLYALKKRKK